MARPWPKKSAWPYVAKSERKSYTVGFHDHDKRERSRTFPSVRHARTWRSGVERTLGRFELGRLVVSCPRSRPTGVALPTSRASNRRRSMRAGGTGYTPARRRRGLGVAS
ncbi:MAG TPA: hypothetical protein VK672_01775 [Solirubrobacteraceae bacterium]|jgi:hypothetical protein|nr:hypothetical protein [Solirubrobacteraceae bacterium]